MGINRASSTDGAIERPHQEYVLDVRIVEIESETNDRVSYRFDAPEHTDVVFDDATMATLYADVYFSVNGFVESGTGERGIPPDIVQAGKHTLAAYLVTQTSLDWVASFYGADPGRIEEYISRVREEADEIRTAAENETAATQMSE